MNEGEDKNERIKARAHQIWESEGKTEGQEDKHWERAELEIMREDAKPNTDSGDN
ncbi:DUF2934 domain-containing protein [Tardiphaga sp.]|jgi:hypothetical protein|uniref:DUF2934 domain-containing protein n=1 Tax=Tardiphaga sp. TaxID=1926292 RepID=UPI0037D9F364